MSDGQDETTPPLGKVKEFADNAWVVLSSRLSGPLILATCGWMLNNVSQMKTDIAMIMATLAGNKETVAAQMKDQDDKIQATKERMDGFDQWRNTFEAYGIDEKAASGGRK